MYAPHTVTVYYGIENQVTFKTSYYITVLRGVFYDAVKAANVKTSGLDGADAVDLFIPFSTPALDGVTGEEKRFVSPKEFAAAEDKSVLWTLDAVPSCFFVKGEVVRPDDDFQYINLNFDNVHRVTKVDIKDFGTPDMQHIQVGGA